MMFTWTILIAKSKELIDSGDFYGFMLFCAMLVDTGLSAFMLAKVLP